MKIGEKCPGCGTPVARKAAMFYWRGVFHDGAVCEKCNSLFVIDGEEIEPLRPSESKPGSEEE